MHGGNVLSCIFMSKQSGLVLPSRPTANNYYLGILEASLGGGRVFRMMTCRAEVYAGKRRSYNDGPGGSSSLLEVLVVCSVHMACCFALLLVPLCRAVGSEFTNCTSQAPLFPLKINPLNFTFGATENRMLVWLVWLVELANCRIGLD